MIVGNYTVASLNEDKALRIRKKILPEDSPILARTYNDCGVAALHMYDFNKGLNYLERGNSERGLIFAKKALEIFEKYPPQNLYEKANAHNTLAQAFKSVKKYAESLKQAKISIDIPEKIAPNNIDVAISYRNIADTYALNGEYEKALTLTKKALQILEEKLPPNHCEISQTYSFISKIYKSLGDTESQDFYSQKFHSILYENQKKLDKAQKFILTSIKNILPTTDASDKYLTYFTASKIFTDSEKMDEAINFAEKSLTAAETLQDKFSVLSTLHFHLGELYSKIGKHEISLKNFLAALEIQQNLAEPEISFVLILKKAAGNEFLALKNFAQAEKIFFEVLSEQLKFLPEFHSDVQITKNILNFARNKIPIMY